MLEPIIYRCDNCNKKFHVAIVTEDNDCETSSNDEPPKYCPFCSKSDKLLKHSKS